MIEESGDAPMAPSQEVERLQFQVAILRRLVESMALRIPRERLSDEEREMLDDILRTPVRRP
jgi:hypothetical protein